MTLASLTILMFQKSDGPHRHPMDAAQAALD